MSSTLATVIGSIIGLAGAVLVAVITYATTQRREREAEWRKEKLSYYKALIESLTEFTSRVAAIQTGLGNIPEQSHEPDRRAFYKASDNLLLFAPLEVLEVLFAFREQLLNASEDESGEKTFQLFIDLLSAIREDLGVSRTNMPFKLFASNSNGESAA